LKLFISLTRIVVVSATLYSAGTGSAFAGLITVDLGKNLQLTQTDAAGDMANPSAYFAARAFYQNTGDFDSATLAWPGPASPASMNNVPGTYEFLNGDTAAGYFISQSTSYGTQAAMDAAYPTGSYVYSLNNSGDPSLNTNSTIDYSGDLYPANQPTLTAASFNSLQGLNATQAVTVSFAALQDNPDFDAGAGDEDFVFLDVYTAGFGSDVYSTYSASPAGLTDFVIPANTLLPGTGYSLLLDFDDRTSGTDGNEVNQFQLFDVKTEVDFTTAVAVTTPEPAAFELAGLGLLALAWTGRRRRA